MRHNKTINHLSRKSAHRKAMLANMASSLILKKRINTTLAKAKALRTFVEPLITKSKDDSTHSRRVVFSYLNDKEAVTELFREVARKVADRPGGYTRILKTGFRLGDNAEMCMMELVDYNENLLGTKEQKQKSSRRRRSSSTAKKKTETTAVKEDVDVIAIDNEETPVDAVETPTDTTAEVVEETKPEVVDEIIEEVQEKPKAKTDKKEPKAETDEVVKDETDSPPEASDENIEEEK